MDTSLAEMEGHTRTPKQARPIFDSERDEKNKQGQRGDRVYKRVWYIRSGSGESKKPNIYPHKSNYISAHLLLHYFTIKI